MKTNHILLFTGAILLTLPAAAQPKPPATPARHVEGELLVKFAGGPRGAQAEQARGRMRHEVKRHFDFIGWQHIRLPRGMTVEEGLEHYRNMPGVEAVELNGVVAGFEPIPNLVENGFAPAGAPSIPNDPMFPQQWGLATIGASNAWAVTIGSSNVVVAVLDTGVNYNHEDLRDNMWRNLGEIPGNGIDDDANGYVDDIYGIDVADHDSDPMDLGHISASFHGTACASIAGAAGNNGLGLAGVNWSVRIMAIRVGTTNSILTFAGLIESYEYLTAMKRRGVNVRVTSNSYVWNPYTQAFKDAIDAAGREGILTVCAAFNQGADEDLAPVYPASYTSPSVIAVAASDSSDNLATFSNYGRTNVDLAAPGVAVPLATAPGNSGYGLGSGTSFATPYVAGAAALLFAANPSATAEDVKAALLETVDVLPAFTNKMVSNGRLNVGRAVLHPFIALGAPRLGFQPQAQTLVLSNRAHFTVACGGARPLNYQWLFNGVELAAATNAALELNSVSFADAGAYSVVVTNSFGAVTSQVATLTVIPLLITSHPRGQNSRLTSNVTFSVSVSSPVPVNYRWRFNGTNSVGADSGTLVLPGVQLINEGDYSVEVSNVFGSAVSSNAGLVVLIDPVITVAPVSQSVVAGGSATFSVGFTGNPSPFGVEWRQGSITMASNTVSGPSSFFTLANAHPTNTATWRVIVRNLARNIPTGENRTFTLTVLTDSDGDGLPDVWETTYPAAANGTDDTDLDGLTNDQEYRAGTDPTNALSYLRVDAIALAGESNLVSLRFLAAANKTYTIQQRNAVDGADWNRLADVLAAPTNRVIEIIDTNGTSTNPQGYYRLATPRSP